MTTRRCAHDALPLNRWLLKIDQKENFLTGGSKVVQALGHVFLPQMVNALEFEDYRVLDENIGKVFAGALNFVEHWEWDLGGSFVNFLQKTSAQGVGDFEYRGKDSFGQSVFICVHLWPIIGADQLTEFSSK